MIVSKNLSKAFRIYRKAPGLAGSLRSLFHRQFETNWAVQDFNLRIDQGEIVGLLGPNGAGKTTLMKLWTGIVVPSAGTASVLGYTPHERALEYRKQIALVMGQKSQLWWDIPAMDSFNLLRRYYAVPDQAFRERLHELAELLSVADKLHVHVRKLSLGERMKMELIASLLHDPKVLFLDEPTIGLDVVAQHQVREFIVKYHARMRPTIVLTSHYMADVEALCPRVVVITHGRILFDGSIGGLRRQFGNDKKHVTFLFSTAVPEANAPFHGLPAVWNHDRTRVELQVPDDEVRVLGQRVLETLPVTDFFTSEAPIEEVMKSVLSRRPSPESEHAD